jgi:restriction system protein
MGVPDYESIMLPLLEFVGDRREHSLREAYNVLADRLSLSNEQRRELLPSGMQPVFENRVGWAKTYLLKAGLLDSPRRGWFAITERGSELLNERPPKIDSVVLRRYPEFREFKESTRTTDERTDVASAKDAEQTPTELLEHAYQKLRKTLAQELLMQVKSCSPAFFEKLVVDLLLAMGYGGTVEDAGQVVGKSGDEGIDGVIKEDRLGLDVIYVQAKRWDKVVGRPEVQRFVGALQGKRARKGVLITTSSFSGDAMDYARGIDSKVVLIDGERLAELMIDYDVGVSKVDAYVMKRVDADYFSEE